MPRPHLSVIVPVLNERDVLPRLVANLASQQTVHFEVLLCDGGSVDGTLEVATQLASTAPFPLRQVSSGTGRARQMNAGADAALGEWLLFLHADSEFEDPCALMLALADMQRERDLEGGCLAGHFAIHFARSDARPSYPFYFYEAKSRLDLPGCIHGDQGMLMHRSVFSDLNGFEETRPFLEDISFAEKLQRAGSWKLLPTELITSARRFETEGLLQRQVLNALIQNFHQLGWARFFEALPELYRSQDRTRPLALLPYWVKIRELLGQESPFARLHIWAATGRYVRSQAWQFGYAAHCRRQFRRGQCPTMSGRDLEEQMRGFERITNNPPGRAVATVLVWSWFYLTYLYLLLKHRRSAAPPSGG